MDILDNLDMIGRPDVQWKYIDKQQNNDTCAIVAQVSIIRQFGIEISEEDAVAISKQNGWYNSGTLPNDVGKLLEYYHIECHKVINATISDLAKELSQGHGVIVGVFAQDLWNAGPAEELKNFICKTYGLDINLYKSANHAIVVTGIDISDLDNPMVFINDSGVPGGKAQPYPLYKFIDAWGNSKFYFVATNCPLPSIVSKIKSSEWNSIGWNNLMGQIAVDKLDVLIELSKIEQETSKLIEECLSDDELLL